VVNDTLEGNRIPRQAGPALTGRLIEAVEGTLADFLSDQIVALDAVDLLVVLGGPVGYAGGLELAGRVAAQTSQLAPVTPSVVAGTVVEEPIMRGAILHGLDAVRESLFD